jgi:K+-sensing histidine kinase KdpD
MPDRAAAHALLALAVHELRSPASVIGGALRLLAADAPNSLAPDERRLVDRACRAAERLEALLAEASELCRLEAGEAVFARRPLSLDPLVDRVVSAFRPPDDLPLVVERRGSSGSRLVLADPVRLERALATLLDVAARSACRGGTLVVAVAPIEPASLAVRAYEAAAEDAADPAADLPLLGPLADDRPGCGLGVALARRTIEAEGGRVSASPAGAPAFVVQIVLPVQA